MIARLCWLSSRASQRQEEATERKQTKESNQNGSAPRAALAPNRPELKITPVIQQQQHCHVFLFHPPFMIIIIIIIFISWFMVWMCIYLKFHSCVRVPRGWNPLKSVDSFSPFLLFCFVWNLNVIMEPVKSNRLPTTNSGESESRQQKRKGSVTQLRCTDHRH